MTLVYANLANITELALQRWGTARSPRLSELMTSMIRHLHDFARETKLTKEEWVAAMDFLAATGRISDDKRQEFILASDVIGLSMLVVMLDEPPGQDATPPTVLGPFHIEDSPSLSAHGNAAGDIKGKRLHVSGRVLGPDGSPIAGATLDFWQSDAEGTYEAQLPESGARLRAILKSDEEGRYGLWTIAPKGYSIPMDGPVGALIEQTSISPYRPAHIHFIVSAKGYRSVTTHLFQAGTDFLETDVVFGTREELVTPFVEHSPGEGPGGALLAEPFLTVSYDFVLASV